ncbi:Csu type fimbrial protein [Asticcacaulis machinosus]|uniref:Spore coat U domain-containing protein n=1 Tax=Asticcacaulis machinosus TaxID=2984211 RepID=A0ABT5HMN5_9CAUL|nr:spore coat U domain-containing protein [Asticcacaulis machinosus]MDC7677510.1 spore coat U domain-containing protein [Asticcacaulis machinosus]
MRRLLIAAVFASLLPASVSAQTKTGQFNVRVQVQTVCSITTQDLDFGTYTLSAAATASTPLSLKCTPGATATLSLDGGSSGNPQQRYMQGPANLNYQIYRDGALAEPINTGGAAFQLSPSENTGQLVTYTLYGQVPAGQSVPAGGYVDTIIVTVSY